MDEIHNYEGTINQFTGDGAMALFGAPVAHEIRTPGRTLTLGRGVKTFPADTYEAKHWPMIKNR